VKNREIGLGDDGNVAYYSMRRRPRFEFLDDGR
jgi:hypothetical protein